MLMKFGLGEDCLSKESIFIVSRSDIKKFDYLIFVDSKGLVIDDEINEPYIYFLKNKLDYEELNYIIISRPKNLTTFATLHNFLNLNKNLHFENLISNLGFVDCTPKKDQNINDMLLQISQFSNSKNEIIEFEKIQLSDGKIEILKSIDYALEFKKEISIYLQNRFEKLYFINTPMVGQDIKIERKRPKSFFKQLKITNYLINELVNFDRNKNKLIDISKLAYTYDGVHHTSIGHKKIYTKILKELSL